PYPPLEVSKPITYTIGSDLEDVGPTNEGENSVKETPSAITPSNIASNITLNNQTPSEKNEGIKIAGCGDTVKLFERGRGRRKRDGGTTKVRSQPSGPTREPVTKNIPLLLASHLRETERKRRTLSPRRAMGVSRDPPTNSYPLNNFYYPNGAYPPSKVYPTNNIYPPSHVYP
ncbi:hypothetical protein Tco_0915623, partial [Tanacetum coccineum]